MIWGYLHFKKPPYVLLFFGNSQQKKQKKTYPETNWDPVSIRDASNLPMSQGVSCDGTFWHVARIPEVYGCCWDIIKDVGWSAFFGISGYSWISSVWYVRSKMVIDLPWLIWVSSIPCVVPLYWLLDRIFQLRDCDNPRWVLAQHHISSSNMGC